MLDNRRRSTVQEDKAKSHVTEDVVSNGQVRQEDVDGTAAAAEAADVGGRREQEHITNTGRRMQNACNPVVKDQHGCYTAVARTVVNNDGKGGTVLNPVAWCSGLQRPEARAGPTVKDLPGYLVPASMGIWGLATLASMSLRAILLLGLIGLVRWLGFVLTLAPCLWVVCAGKTHFV